MQVSSSSNQWPCSACTFLNEAHRDSCEICNSSKVKNDYEVIDLTKALSPCPSMESAKRKKKRKLQEENNAGTVISYVDNDCSTDTMHLTSPTKSSMDATVKRKESSSKVESFKILSHASKSCGMENANHRNSNTDTTTKTGNSSQIPKATKIPKSNEKTQTTLFGTIVKNIQNTDLKTCSNQPQSFKKKNSHVCEQSISKKENKSVTFDRDETTKGPQKVKNRNNKLFIEAKYHAMKSKQDEVMRNIFKIQSLRNLQPKAIDCALKRKNQIIIMATGGGKSLCYQLPAALMSGITIVVSPLIALMTDQVQSLIDKGIEAASICSANGQKANMAVMQRLVGRNDKNQATKMKVEDQARLDQKPIKLLYCTPELIKTNKFRAILSNLYQRDQLSLVAIDEAHCLSTWGHDFRPAYCELHWVRTTFPDVPCMACTATATPKVVADIRDVLKFGRDVPCHMSTFNRTNISYEVRYKDALDNSDKTSSIGDLIKTITKEHQKAANENRPCSGIIYVHKRNDTSMLVAQINKVGIIAAPYHAGLKDSERKEIQENWTMGKIQVAVATVAFGMGIDLPHVRYVVHWSIAKSLEGFYQESGRGGRDGNPSVSIVYYSKSDESLFAFLIKKQEEKKNKDNPREHRENPNLKALEGMVEYCKKTECRRKSILQHFGEKIDPKVTCKRTCDYCKNPKQVEKALRSSYESIASKHIKNQFKSFNYKAVSTDTWDDMNGSNLDDMDEDYSWDGLYDAGSGQLGITKAANESSGTMNQSSGFMSAKDTLAKYEAMELKAGNKSGFVTFKAKGKSSMPIRKKLLETEEVESSTSTSYVQIPQHLRGKLPDPLNDLSKMKESKNSETNKKSSTEIASDVDRLKAELKALKEKRQQSLEKKQSKGNHDQHTKNDVNKGQSINSHNKTSLPSPPPPPPPPLSFRRRRHKSKK